MLGYVRHHKPNLRICDYETYKSIYCSLCREMGKRYGRLTRFALSYDFAFLAVLGLSLQEEDCTFVNKSCVCNPLKRCRYCCTQTEVLKYCSCASVILLYFKFRDDILDKSFLASLLARCASLYLKGKIKRAKRDYPELWEIICEQTRHQNQLEQKKSSGIDEAAHPTATMLSGIVTQFSKTAAQTRILSRLGYCLGRWIYLIDAVDDLQKDLKKHNYNPLVASGMVNTAEDLLFKKQEIEQMLTVCISEVVDAYRLLQINRFSQIIENVLYQGLDAVQNTVLKERTDICEGSV